MLATATHICGDHTPPKFRKYVTREGKCFMRRLTSERVIEILEARVAPPRFELGTTPSRSQRRHEELSPIPALLPLSGLMRKVPSPPRDEPLRSSESTQRPFPPPTAPLRICLHPGVAWSVQCAPQLLLPADERCPGRPAWLPRYCPMAWILETNGTDSARRAPTQCRKP